MCFFLSDRQYFLPDIHTLAHALSCALSYSLSLSLSLSLSVSLCLSLSLSLSQELLQGLERSGALSEASSGVDLDTESAMDEFTSAADDFSSPSHRESSGIESGPEGMHEDHTCIASYHPLSLPLSLFLSLPLSLPLSLFLSLDQEWGKGMNGMRCRNRQGLKWEQTVSSRFCELCL